MLRENAFTVILENFVLILLFLDKIYLGSHWLLCRDSGYPDLIGIPE